LIILDEEKHLVLPILCRYNAKNANLVGRTYMCRKTLSVNGYRFFGKYAKTLQLQGRDIKSDGTDNPFHHSL
jgi:hypothetical protein